MTDILRLRKELQDALPTPVWPAAAHLQALSSTDPRQLHAILAGAYTNGFGNAPPFDDWWLTLIADTEFDPALVFVAADGAGQPVGLAQCWTSGFIKDIAVVPAWRGRHIGEVLLQEIFVAFRQRGLHHVDLKVFAANAPAIALYRRMGMVDAPL